MFDAKTWCMTFSQDIDFKGGHIVWNGLDDSYDEYLATQKPYHSYLWSEDELYVKYDDIIKENIALDAGWYGQVGEGCFMVYIVKDDEWDEPYYLAIVNSFEELKETLIEAIDIIINRK